MSLAELKAAHRRHVGSTRYVLYPCMARSSSGTKKVDCRDATVCQQTRMNDTASVHLVDDALHINHTGQSAPWGSKYRVSMRQQRFNSAADCRTNVHTLIRESRTRRLLCCCVPCLSFEMLLAFAPTHGHARGTEFFTAVEKF